VQKAAGSVMSPLSASWCCAESRRCRCAFSSTRRTGARGGVLSTHPKVSKLAYPGLKSHPQHELAVRQQKGFGSMMSFEVKSRDEAARFLKAIKLFINAESLGGSSRLLRTRRRRRMVR